MDGVVRLVRKRVEKEVACAVVIKDSLEVIGGELVLKTVRHILIDDMMLMV